MIEGSSGRGGIEPVKLAKRAAREMEREKMVSVGHEYAPTLYNVLVSPDDDERMSGYYPSLAGEVETYLTSAADRGGLVFDCPPLVRFIVDDGLKRGKFDIIAESVSPAIISELRHEEMVHYGIEEDIPMANSYSYEAQPPRLRRARRIRAALLRAARLRREPARVRARALPPRRACRIRAAPRCRARARLSAHQRA